MKSVACYVRVSTENQIENYSIEEQIDRLKAYCKAKDYSIYKMYTDGGYSGGNINRPALQQLIADIEHGRVDAVVVYKLDRLSRSQKDTLTLIEDEFLSNNIDFISLSENFDTSTPFGRAMIGILSVFAQLEKDQITERFTMGRIGRSKSGYFHGGGNAPKGYKYIDGELIIDEYEAMQVRELFGLFINGRSINAISLEMTSKYGGIWNNANKVSNVLKNSIYCGKVKFKGQEYDGQHQSIITEEMHQRVNALLSSRENTISTALKTPFRAGYLLSSLVFCGDCGARYSANHGFYKCYSRSKATKKFIVNPDCKNKNWVIPELDALVVSEIRRLAFGDNLNTLFKQTKQRKPVKSDADIIQKNIEETDAQISKLLDLYQLDNMPIEQISEKIAKLQEGKVHLTERLSKSVVRSDAKDRQKDFAEKLKNIDAAFNSGTEGKRLFISALVEKIIIHGENVKIQWRL